MPILAGVVVVIQFCFAFHVFKTGRPYWWIFVIMAFPVMGCVIYYLVEVFPGSREERQAHGAARKIARALQPDADLQHRVEQVELCGSVENKMSLAAECFDHRMYAEAEKLYEGCLSGAFQDDAAILLGLARAAVENRDWNTATAAISRLKAAAPKMRPGDVQLLEARILEGQGQNDAALSAYRELVPAYVGLEARYRYAVLLSRLGHQEAAMQVFNEVIKHAKRFSSSVEDEQRWVKAAREAVVKAEA